MATSCGCPETECTNKKHPANKACTVVPMTLQGREVLAGWSAGRCPSCGPQVIKAMLKGAKANEAAMRRVYGEPADEKPH